MAEAGIGLAVSLISLATVFKACIDSFELYKAAEDSEESLKTVLVELDCEKERLLIWAEAIGLVQLASDKRHPDIEKHEKVIKAALEQIRNLLDDATKLQERYGVKVFDDSNAFSAATMDPMSKNLATMFKIAYKRFSSRLNPSDGNTSGLTMKIRWAIRDRAKFMGLIVTLKGFVDRLFQIIPISREVQNTMVEADIFSIMDLSQLRLVEAACEGSYRAWSEFASVAIDRTERETIDQCTHRDDQEHDLRTSFRSSQTDHARTTAPESICQGGCPNISTETS
jgi:Prion-inhibition and propagation